MSPVQFRLSAFFYDFDGNYELTVIVPSVSVLLLAVLLSFSQLLIPVELAKARDIDIFAAKPYLQLGTQDKTNTDLEVVWMSKSAANWRLEVRQQAKDNWRVMPTPTATSFSPSHVFIFHVQVTNLKAGAPFEYRLLSKDEEVFKSTGTAKKSALQSFRFVVVGDIGARTSPSVK